MSLFSELKRRNVFRVATAYIIVAWLLTEILATILPMFGVPDWVGKAIVIVAAVTFIPVMIFAWAFEITPEGIKLEKDVERDSSITSQTGKKLDYVTIAVVIIGVVFLGLSKSRTDDPPPTVEVTQASVVASVAVLPFVNMSGNAENEYFSDGLTETLLHMLAQVPEIKVAARTSSFAFKGQDQDVRKIALALGVAHILEGSVQRSGDKIRVTAQLIRADDGFHVWSSNYDRTLDDIFAIQDEIAADVGQSLTASLLGKATIDIEGVGTENLIAYDLFLQARGYRATGSYGGLKDAEELLKEALILDSEFIDAKVLLAEVYGWQQGTGLRDPGEAYASAIELLEQVLDKRPDNALANAMHITYIAYQVALSGAYMAIADAIPVLEELVAKTPGDAEIRAVFGYLLFDAGRLVDALYQLEQVLSSDPMNPIIHHNIGMTHLLVGDWLLAQAAFERSIALNPDQPNAHDFLGVAKRGMGDAVGSLQSTLKAIEIDSRDPELTTGLAGYLYEFGLVEEGNVYRARTALLSPNNESTRLANLNQARALGDVGLSDQIARSMVEDDVAERHGTYVMAVHTVLKNAIRHEDAMEGLAFMEQHQPGFNDPTADAIDQKVRLAQSRAFAAWYATRTPEETAQMVSDYMSLIESSGIILPDHEMILLEVLAIQGDTSGAVDYALEKILSDPISRSISRRDRFDAPYFSAVVADPRVQAGLQQWDKDALTVKAEMKEYLAGVL
jgi:TolB-like protein/Flp pilus assembly protein TadD